MRHALLALLIAGCASRPPLVDLSPTWPTTARPYGATHARWTRHDSIWRNEHTVEMVDGFATLEWPEWRAAFLGEQARRAHVPSGELEKQIAASKADADAAYTIELLLQTRDDTWNDLANGTTSMWRISLVADGDREVAPMSVLEDRRPRGEISSYFPDLTPFHRAYVLRFPRTDTNGRPLVDESTGRLVLKVGSGVGAMEFVWATR